MIARFVLLLALSLAGCINYVTTECPSCRVINGGKRGAPDAKLPRIRATTKRLFVLIPGALGYSWEWTPAVKRIEASSDVELVVFWWEPYGSVQHAARDLERWVNDLVATRPPALEEIVIVAHSVAGIVAAYAAPKLMPAPGLRIKLATIGTPFAGMIGPDFGYPDSKGSLALFATYSPWLRYPAPASGLDIVEYRTTWPEDPVMEPRFGHDPAPVAIGPQPRRRVQLPHMDHNRCVDLVVKRLLEGRE